MEEPSVQEQFSSEQTSPGGNKHLAFLFFPLAFLFHEYLLRFFNDTISFTDHGLLSISCAALSFGCLVAFLFSLPIPKKLRIILGWIACFLWTSYVCISYCCKSFFRAYFSLGYILGMSHQVVSNFSGTIVEVIQYRIPFILLSLIPLLIFTIFFKKIIPDEKTRKKRAITQLFLFLGLMLIVLIDGSYGTYHNVYTHDFTPDRGVPIFGLITSTRLELQYKLFGLPQNEFINYEIIEEEPIQTPAYVPAEKEERVILDFNKTDIDFESLEASTSDSTISKMHSYFHSQIPSIKNEYTGLFKGKNLILITAEAFSPYVISKELTPTLYKLTHEGFVFNNYYQPGWGQSTTGGEYAVMTGLIPTWIDNNLSFIISARDDMPFALGNQFRSLGYATRAYHNNSYTYYGRDRTHPNLGYDYKGLGNGLIMETGSNGHWPSSDLEMMQVTMDEYVSAYVNDGIPFHTYYMTVSGHAYWSWGNAMSGKNKEAAQEAYPDYSQPVQGYIAANLELEYALEYILETLENAGILDDTVICLSADHYPYGLIDPDSGVDHYNELRGFSDTEQDITRYKNSLILYCSSMEKPVIVNTPCSAIDIVPTLSNLFGLTYDSRLLSGRDILAPNNHVDKVSSCMPLVILPTNYGMSWITDAGTYDAHTRTFTPNDHINVSDTYVESVSNICNTKFNYARMIIQYDYYHRVYSPET